MKIKKMMATVTAVLLLISVAMALPAVAADVPAILNGGFEELSEGGNAVSWSFTAGAETVTEDTEGAYSGNYVKLTGPDQHVTGTTVTGLTAGETYVLSFAIKSQDQNIAMLGLEQRNAAEDKNVSSMTSSSWPVTHGAWRKVSYTFTLTEGADSVRIDLRTLTSAYFEAEEMEFVCYDTVSLDVRKDLVLNGSMEAVTDNSPDNWTPSSSANVVPDSSIASEGKYSLRLTGAGNETLVRAHQADVAATYTSGECPIGYKYRITADINIPEELEGAGFRIIVYRNGVGTTGQATQIGSSSVAGGITQATGGWRKVIAYFGNKTTAITTVQVALELTGTGTVYVDNISIEPILGELQNGDFEAFGHNGTNWTAGICGSADAGLTCEIDTTANVAYAGTGCLKFAKNTAAGSIYMTIEGLPQEAGIYRVDYMYKHEGYASPTLNNMTDENAWTQLNAVDSDIEAKNNWSRCTTYIPKQAGFTYIKLRLYTGNTLSGYVDNMTVSLDTNRTVFVSETDRSYTANMADAGKAEFRFVSETESADLPDLMVAAYKTISGAKVLCCLTVAPAPKAKTLTVGEKNWYTYTYICDLPEAEGAEYVEAFAWNGVIPLTDKEAAR